MGLLFKVAAGAAGVVAEQVLASAVKKHLEKKDEQRRQAANNNNFQYQQQNMANAPKKPVYRILLNPTCPRCSGVRQANYGTGIITCPVCNLNEPLMVDHWEIDYEAYEKQLRAEAEIRRLEEERRMAFERQRAEQERVARAQREEQERIERERRMEELRLEQERRQEEEKRFGRGMAKFGGITMGFLGFIALFSGSIAGGLIMIVLSVLCIMISYKIS